MDRRDLHSRPARYYQSAGDAASSHQHGAAGDAGGGAGSGGSTGSDTGNGSHGAGAGAGAGAGDGDALGSDLRSVKWTVHQADLAGLHTHRDFTLGYRALMCFYASSQVFVVGGVEG